MNAMWVAVVSAAFAAVAALATLWVARGTTRGNEVQVFLEFSDRYRGQEVRNAIRLLAGFWRDNQDIGVAKAWLDLRGSDDTFAEEIAAACRLLGSYFDFAIQLYDLGLVSKPVVRELINHPGLNVYYEVVVPVMEAQFPKRALGQVSETVDRRLLRKLRRLRKKFGSGIF